MADPTEQRLDDHKRRLDEHSRRITTTEQLAADVATAVWGNPDRGVPGLERRVQGSEKLLRVLIVVSAIGAVGTWYEPLLSLLHFLP